MHKDLRIGALQKRLDRLTVATRAPVSIEAGARAT